MDTVGIRELRQRASALLRRVERGERIEITDRGRPIAVLAPVPDSGALERLEAIGALERASRSLADLPEPLPPAADAELPSDVLARLRRDER